MKKTISFFCFLSLAFTAYSQPYPELKHQDKVRIQEARTIAGKYSEAIWPGMSQVPFTVLLLTDSAEFLLHHSNPSAEFTSLGKDSLLGTEVYFREPQFSKNLLATFPAVNGQNCIVVGTPENTGKTSTDWIVTLLHEYFHLYTYTSPYYFASVEKLDLANGDNTGMWMLNYDFPYEEAGVTEAYTHYTAALASAVANTSTDNISRYSVARRKLKQVLHPADYRYFSFQLWQEGIARYTEYKFLEQLQTHQPSVAVQALPDFTSYSTYREQLLASQLQRLHELRLPQAKRVCFYDAGFAEGLLLDRLNPDWRGRYLSDKFYLERYSDLD